MKPLWWIENPRSRVAVSVAATAGLGQMIARGLTQHLGPTTGYLVGLVTVAALALGFSAVLFAIAGPKSPSADD